MGGSGRRRGLGIPGTLRPLPVVLATAVVAAILRWVPLLDAFVAMSPAQLQPYLRLRAVSVVPRQAGAPGSAGILDELLATASSADAATLQAGVNARFGELTPGDLSTLQVRLGSASGTDKAAMQLLTECIQMSMEARMAQAKADLDALLVSTGDIKKNIRDCLAKQDSPLPIMTLLQLNIASSQRAGQEKMVQALAFVLSVMNEQLEDKVPAVNRLLTKVLAIEDADARRTTFQNYLASGAGQSRELSAAIVKLVADAEEKFSNAGGAGGQLASTLELIRRVAIDAGIVIGEALGEEEQTQFTSDLTPLFEALSKA